MAPLVSALAMSLGSWHTAHLFVRVLLHSQPWMLVVGKHTCFVENIMAICFHIEPLHGVKKKKRLSGPSECGSGKRGINRCLMLMRNVTLIRRGGSAIPLVKGERNVWSERRAISDEPG